MSRARVYGQLKDASPEVVEQMEATLETYADIIENSTGLDARRAPGSGASGGLGAGLSTLVGAWFDSRFDVITEYLAFDHL